MAQNATIPGNLKRVRELGREMKKSKAQREVLLAREREIQGELEHLQHQLNKEVEAEVTSAMRGTTE